ncbi:hypothetical protein D3C75_593940 [compost metagenome]
MEWSGLLGLICPLMMIGMMVWMMRGNGGKAGGGCCSKPGQEADAAESGSVADLADQPKHGNNRRRWLMLLCCLVPVVAAALLLLGRPAGAAGSWLPFVMLLACPLSHLLLMPLLHRGGKHSSH